MIWKPVCLGYRVNTEDNPNYFCALVPPPNGVRKSGLWEKMSDFVESLGPDPNKDVRASADSPADSSPFVKTLELDNGVQQDSHEFLTLLLSLLERCLSHSKVSEARTIVQDLFRGSASYVTTYESLNIRNLLANNTHHNVEEILKLLPKRKISMNWS
ncbi:hypothetical protein TSUD_313710 [Trifolium subterraneum]|uniref:Peptidase C19 ubiquitin carboxyl-terminal hydrolase domain-containing protein n=1 Tax=Trifolium subterraneum TaxID=3900 RepID=A0A2Z6MDZ4_TRISU|nr:hypothetical protein TSUD_313710 [Trifolium subterraneum]